MKILNREQWLFCLRGGLSMMIAYFATHGNEPYNAIYAVMGAGLVTAPSVGEGIGISKDRLIGTLLGALVSVPASWLGSPVAALAAAACFVMPLGILLGGVPVGRIALTVAAVTVVLHTGSAQHYGVLRFTNTLAGVATALIVSFAFWPFCGRFSFADAIHSALGACATLAEKIAAFEPGTSLLEAQKGVFSILSTLPKTAGHARLDPLLYRQKKKMEAETQLIAKIGIALLSVSLNRARSEIAPNSAEQSIIGAYCRHIAMRLSDTRVGYTRKKPPGLALAVASAGAGGRPNAFPEAEPPTGIATIIDELMAIDDWLDELQSLQRIKARQ